MLKLTIEGDSNYIQAVSNFLITLDEKDNKSSKEEPKKPKKEINKKEVKEETIVEEVNDTTVDKKEDKGAYTIDKLDEVFREALKSDREQVKGIITSYNIARFTELKELIKSGEVSIEEVGDKLAKILGGVHK